MTKWMLAAGAAALAMTAPAMADKGGNGHGNGGGHANVERSQGHGGGHAEFRGNGGGSRHAEMRGNGGRSDHRMNVEQAFRGHDRVKVENHGRDHVRIAERGDHGDRGAIRIKDNGKIRIDGDRGLRVVTNDRFDDHDGRFAPRWDNRGLVAYDGCPPGLAKKGNGCMPPGLAKKVVGTTLPSALAANVLGGPYRDWYRDDDRYFYRSDDNYIYRVNRDGGLIDALFPYANRDYFYYPVGDQYPSAYNYYNVPYQYRSYYPDNGDMWYRYGDGAIYSVNPGNGLISGIAALLAGDLSVGQQLPSAYSVYNVPLSYRDRYYDTPDNWYRYNDGYIYRVDPTTQLITAVISAIV